MVGRLAIMVLLTCSCATDYSALKVEARDELCRFLRHRLQQGDVLVCVLAALKASAWQVPSTPAAGAEELERTHPLDTEKSPSPSPRAPSVAENSLLLSRDKMRHEPVQVLLSGEVVYDSTGTPVSVSGVSSSSSGAAAKAAELCLESALKSVAIPPPGKRIRIPIVMIADSTERKYSDSGNNDAFCRVVVGSAAY